MVLTWLIGALAACGVLLIFRALLNAFNPPLPPRDAVHVLYVRGDASVVQQLAKACLRQREQRGMYGTLVFVDDGLQTEAQIALELLLRGQNDAFICTRAQLAEYFLGEKEAWIMN